MSRIDERAQSDLQRQIDRLAALLEEIKSRESPAYPARYSTNAGQSIPNITQTIIDFEDVGYDPYSLVTTGANWKYTAPVAGYYAVSALAMLSTAATWADNELFELRVYKNGGSFAALNINNGAGSASAIFKGAGGATIMKLAEADYIDIRLYQASGGPITLYTNGDYNHVSIWKVQ